MHVELFFSILGGFVPGPPWIPKPRTLKYLMLNGIVFAYNLYIYCILEITSRLLIIANKK